MEAIDYRKHNLFTEIAQSDGFSLYEEPKGVTDTFTAERNKCRAQNATVILEDNAFNTWDQMLVRLAAVSCHHIRIWSIHSSIPQITQNVDIIFLLNLLHSINRAIETYPLERISSQKIFAMANGHETAIL